MVAKKDVQFKNLLALRDEVLAFYKEVKKAAEDDSEVTIGGNGVNSFEALTTLEPLKELADKCSDTAGLPFSGMTFVITGALSGMTREEIHQKIRELGGEVSDSVSRKVTHLVVGEKPGSKLDQAKKIGTCILTEGRFLEMIGTPRVVTAKMSTDERKEIRAAIESEGFDYCFTSYSDFADTKDSKFHELREAYLKARKELADHIGYQD